MTENTKATGQERQITAGSVAKYALLPGILPRLKRLGFVLAKFLHVFTTLFGAAGLIPANHPCLRPENIGRYKFTEIVGLAAHNVRFSKDNIPQIVMFFAIIGAYLLTILTAILGVLQMVVGHQAHAQFFTNPSSSPVQIDYAYNLLHLVFGPTGLNSIWTGSDDSGGYALNGVVNPISLMFQAMLGHYSKALLILAAFMIVYMLIMATVEAAQSGKPFGRIFNGIWGPIRLAMAIGLLVPISGAAGSGGGYNSAQLIVFQIAHWGSALASNVWAVGLNALASNQNYLADVRTSKGYDFLRAVWLSEVCTQAWNNVNGSMGLPESVELNQYQEGDYIVFEAGTKSDPTFCGSYKIPATLNKKIKAPTTAIIARIGTFSDTLTDVDISSYADLVSARYMLAYSNSLVHIITASDKFVDEVVANKMVENLPQQELWHSAIVATWIKTLDGNGAAENCTGATAIADSLRKCRFFDEAMFTNKKVALEQRLRDMLKNYTLYGWAGAGGFYLRIADFSQAMAEASRRQPQVLTLPRLLLEDSAMPGANNFLASLSPKKIITGLFAWGNEANQQEGLKQINIILNVADKWFRTSPMRFATDTAVFPDTAKWQSYLKVIQYSTVWKKETADNMQSTQLAGTSNFDVSNVLKASAYGDIFMFTADDSLNPIGKIATIGNTLMIVGGAAYGSGIVLGAQLFGTGLPKLGDFLFSIGTIIFLAGFTLSYVVPMMPFFFFTFTVVEWIMGVIEAIIGMPLLALAFLMGDNQSLLAGQVGSGVMRLFEIMLRPTMIIFGLIMSILVFTAGSWFLNQTFQNYVTDAAQTVNWVGSWNPLTWVVNQVIFAFAIYSLGNASFKMIDQIPTSFMNWFGGSAGFGNNLMSGLKGNEFGAAIVAKQALDGGQKFGQGVAGNIVERRAQSQQKAQQASQEDMLNQNLTTYNPTYDGYKSVAADPTYSSYDRAEAAQAAKDIEKQAMKIHKDNYKTNRAAYETLLSQIVPRT